MLSYALLSRQTVFFQFDESTQLIKYGYVTTLFYLYGLQYCMDRFILFMKMGMIII